MTKAQKKAFIRELFKSIEISLIEKIDKMPEEWDGIEIRELAADKFAESTLFHRRRDLRQRATNYRNEVIVRNL